jgi:hypothetical protein
MMINSRMIGEKGHVHSRDVIAFKIVVGNPEDKRPLGRPRRRWEDNIRIDLKEI